MTFYYAPPSPDLLAYFQDTCILRICVLDGDVRRQFVLGSDRRGV
jgi:hypothetical protein